MAPSLSPLDATRSTFGLEVLDEAVCKAELVMEGTDAEELKPDGKEELLTDVWRVKVWVDVDEAGCVDVGDTNEPSLVVNAFPERVRERSSDRDEP